MKKSLIALLLVLFFAMVPAISAEPIEIKYFYSTGCSHCRTTTPILEDIAEEYEGIVELKKCNINSSEYGDLWNDYKDRFSISGVPAIIVNDKHKLSGDAQITYSRVTELIEEIMSGIGAQGDELYNEALLEMENGNFDVAIGLFEDAAYIYTLAEDEDKHNLCLTKIGHCEDYKDARDLFSQAEAAFYSEQYDVAAPLYGQVMDIYTQLGNSQMATRSEMRLFACNFHIHFSQASDAFSEADWQSAKDNYEQAVLYTSDAQVIASIQEKIATCDQQIYATGLIDLADARFEDGSYAEAKQAYGEAVLIVSDPDSVTYCNSRVAECDKYILAQDTYDYASQQLDAGNFVESMTLFQSAQSAYAQLGNSEKVALCQDGYDDAYQAKVEYDTEIARQEREERNRRITIIAVVAAVLMAAVASVYIFTRKEKKVSHEDCEYDEYVDENTLPEESSYQETEDVSEETEEIGEEGSSAPVVGIGDEDEDSGEDEENDGESKEVD